MKIRDITLTRSQTPLKKAFTTALRSVTTIDEIILSIETDTALIGYGSAPATLAVTGDDLEKISADLDRAKELFSGYELLDYRVTFEKLLELHLCKSAQAAFDIALHDLFAKEAGVPLFEYLGGSKRALHTLYTISIDTPEKMLDQARYAYDRGFHKLKVKLDRDLDQDIQRVRTLHSALPQAELFLDINQAFTLDQARLFIEALKALPIVLLEQPLKADDREGMRELTALKSIPILADESLFSIEDAVWLIENQACDYFNLKLMKTGGIYEARKILDLAHKHQISCMMGSMLETSISVTAALHLAYAYENVIFADLDGPTLADRFVCFGGIRYEGSVLEINEDLGLGVTKKKMFKD